MSGAFGNKAMEMLLGAESFSNLCRAQELDGTNNLHPYLLMTGKLMAWWRSFNWRLKCWSLLKIQTLSTLHSIGTVSLDRDWREIRIISFDSEIPLSWIQRLLASEAPETALNTSIPSSNHSPSPSLSNGWKLEKYSRWKHCTLCNTCKFTSAGTRFIQDKLQYHCFLHARHMDCALYGISVRPKKRGYRQRSCRRTAAWSKHKPKCIKQNREKYTLGAS